MNRPCKGVALGDFKNMCACVLVRACEGYSLSNADEHGPRGAGSVVGP